MGGNVLFGRRNNNDDDIDIAAVYADCGEEEGGRLQSQDVQVV